MNCKNKSLKFKIICKVFDLFFSNHAKREKRKNGFLKLKMTAMISLNKLSSSPNVNVNVKPSVNVNVSSQEDAKVKYRSFDASEESEATDESIQETLQEINQKLKEQLKETQNEVKVLRYYIDMLKSNPLIYNGYIVADDETLMNFIRILTDADDVQLDAEDIGEGCLSKKTYRKVHAIYVIKNNEPKNLKYDYPKVMKELSDLGISTKFVF